MSLAWKINRVLAMSQSERLHRAGQSLRSALERLGLGLARPVGPQNAAGKSWLPALPAGFDAQPYREAADHILAGRFRIFSLGDAAIGFPPQWNRDPKTGISAPLTFGKSLDYRDERSVGDIKYLWEPNRHLQLVTLAQAWHLSREPRYAMGCRTLVSSWMQQCPYPLGPNWTSSLELAIRLVNWSFAWQLLGGAASPVFHGAEGAAFKRDWLDSIHRHCHFIAGYLSEHSSANNHLLGELLGLFIGATTWPCWPRSPLWRQSAHERFEAEALLQNAADGVNREEATWYHHEVADMMLIAGLVARANDRDFSTEFWHRWEAMLDFIASIMDCAGNVPAFGDADDAVICGLAASGDLNVFESLLATAAVLLERGDLKAKARAFDDKSRWLLGDDAAKRFAGLSSNSGRLPVKRAFPTGGYYVLGSEFETTLEVRVVADAGPLGYLSIAAHGHADALSFVLSVGGRPILIDPGTYAYHTNRLWRDYFRGTAAHNTVRVDSQDQSVSQGTFLWTRHAEARCERFETGKGENRWIASHSGYERLQDPVQHRRELLYRPQFCVLRVTDTLRCAATHQVEIFWHFSDQCTVSRHGATVIARNGPATVTLRAPPDLRTTLALGRDVPPLGWISHGFDAKTPCTTACSSGQINGTWRGVTEIEIGRAAD